MLAYASRTYRCRLGEALRLTSKHNSLSSLAIRVAAASSARGGCQILQTHEALIARSGTSSGRIRSSLGFLHTTSSTQLAPQSASTSRTGGSRHSHLIFAFMSASKIAVRISKRPVKQVLLVRPGKIMVDHVNQECHHWTCMYMPTHTSIHAELHCTRTKTWETLGDGTMLEAVCRATGQG